MAITIGSNIASLSAQRHLSRNTRSIGTVFERLSSGQRINRASDDAAGLAIADSLRKDQRVFNQGVRNFNDGVSLLNIADGALNELTGITTRLVELAEQAANGVLGTQQRKSLHEEGQALKDEYFRIAQTTEFNDRQLFTADFGELRLQGGFGVDGGIASGLGGAIGTGTFETASQNVTGGIARAVTVGDFNGDGFSDIVTTDYGAGNVNVLLGDGGGGFEAGVTLAAGSDAYSISNGDFNGDGTLDLVVGHFADANVSVLLGLGNGTFGAATDYAVAGNSRDVETGDANGDGIDDIFVGSNNGGAGVLLARGDGGFSSYSDLTGPGNADVILTADFNGDGALDFVHATTNGDIANIMIGDGAGGFGTASPIYLEEDIKDMKAGDLNGDGNLELILGHLDSTNSISVSLGNGDGSFGDGSFNDELYYTTNGQTQSLAIADFNGDGILDIVASDDGTTGLSVLLGVGDGTLGTATSYTTGGANQTVAVGDFNTDGVSDIASGVNSAVSVLLGNTTDGVAPLLDFSLETMAGARQALPVFQQKLEQLSQQRGEIGAFQSRLQTGTRVLTSSVENVAAAESRIRDTDIAEESSKLVRLNILQQATAAVLAQANQQPALALQLLS